MELTACRNVTASQCHTTFCTNEIQPSEIVSLTKRLLFAIRAIDGEELGRNDVATILLKECIS